MSFALIFNGTIAVFVLGVIYFIYRFIYVQRKVIKFYSD